MIKSNVHLEDSYRHAKDLSGKTIHRLPHHQSNSKSFVSHSKQEHVIYKEANFSVEPRYQIQKVLGKGSYGVVCSAIDTKAAMINNNETVHLAIKKVSNIFNKEVLLKRAVRELKLMRHFKGHRNVIIYQFPSHNLKS